MKQVVVLLPDFFILVMTDEYVPQIEFKVEETAARNSFIRSQFRMTKTGDKLQPGEGEQDHVSQSR